MSATRGLWAFPEPMNGCSRCGARKPAVLDYVCEATAEADWEDDRWKPVLCGQPAVAVLLDRDEGRCREHLAPESMPRFRAYRLGRKE